MNMLFSSYRLDQYADPDGFAAQAALVMSEYTAEVVVYVTDPRTGIQARLKWPPAISELVDALRTAETVIRGLKLIAKKKAQGLEWDDRLNKFVSREPVRPRLK